MSKNFIGPLAIALAVSGAFAQTTPAEALDELQWRKVDRPKAVNKIDQHPKFRNQPGSYSYKPYLPGMAYADVFLSSEGNDAIRGMRFYGSDGVRVGENVGDVDFTYLCRVPVEYNLHKIEEKMVFKFPVPGPVVETNPKQNPENYEKRMVRNPDVVRTVWKGVVYGFAGLKEDFVTGNYTQPVCVIPYREYREYFRWVDPNKDPDRDGGRYKNTGHGVEESEAKFEKFEYLTGHPALIGWYRTSNGQDPVKALRNNGKLMDLSKGPMPCRISDDALFTRLFTGKGRSRNSVIGFVENGKCNAYINNTDKAAFNRVKDYEVPLLYEDFTTIGKPVMVKNASTPFCLSINPKQGKISEADKGATVVAAPCYSAEHQNMTFDKKGRIHFGKEAGLCVDVPGSDIKNGQKLIAWPCHDEVNQVFFMTKAGEIKTGSGHKCLTVKGTKPGTPVLLEDCAQQGVYPRWSTEPAVYPVRVTMNGEMDGQLVIDGKLGGSQSKCLRTQEGCEIWRGPNQALNLEAMPIGGQENFVRFGGWSGTGCSGGNPKCTIRIKPNVKYDVRFAVDAVSEKLDAPTLFQVRQGDMCLTVAKSGSRPGLAACDGGNEAQMFQAMYKGKEGWLVAIKLQKPICVYHEVGENKDTGAAGMFAGMGLIQGSCTTGNPPKGAGRAEWRLDKAGYIRPRNWKYCLEPKDKAVVYNLCNQKSKAQVWTFPAALGGVPSILQVKTSGHCLTNMGGAGKKGTPFKQAVCTKFKDSQKFAYIYMDADGGNARQMSMEDLKNPAFRKQWDAGVMIKNLASGHCLDVKQRSKSNGAQVHQWPCSPDLKNQRWRAVQRPGGWFQWQAAHSAKCLDLAQGSKEMGGTFHQWDCDPKNPNQNFRDVAALEPKEIEKFAYSAQNEIPRGTHLLQAQYSGLCIDNGNSKDKGKQPIQWSCEAKNPNQLYEVVPLDNVSVQLKNRKSGMCLDVSGASTKNGAKVVQWPCGKQKNQKWNIVLRQDGYSEIRADHSKKCLDIRGPSKNKGAVIQQWDCKDVPQQKWRVYRK